MNVSYSQSENVLLNYPQAKFPLAVISELIPLKSTYKSEQTPHHLIFSKVLKIKSFFLAESVEAEISWCSVWTHLIRGNITPCKVTIQGYNNVFFFQWNHDIKVNKVYDWDDGNKLSLYKTKIKNNDTFGHCLFGDVWVLVQYAHCQMFAMQWHTIYSVIMYETYNQYRPVEWHN